MPNANWSNPTLTSTYTNFVAEVKNRDEDLALQFDGTTSTNIPTNTIRWDSSANRWKKWNGSSWVELTGTYALTALTTTGSVGIGTASPRGLVSIANNAAGTGVVDSSLHLGYSISDYYGHRIVNSNEPTSTAAGLLRFQRGTAAAWVDSVTIDTFGRVGIGTSSPDSALYVAAGSVARLRIGYNSTSFNYYDADTQIFRAVDGTERVRIDSAGRVGIGTAGPSYLLHVNTAAATDVELAVQNSAGLARYGTRTSGNAFAGSFTAGKAFELWSANSQAMTIDSSGRVGIGTAGPSYKLHVVGNTVVPAVVESNQSLSFLTYKDAATTDNPGVGSAGNNLVFYTASNERLRIGPSGQLGLSGANYGTAGQVLTSAGPSAAPTWQSGGFPSGTVMLFVQTAAPTGWTKSTTHDNKALRVVSGSVTTGGTQNFTAVLNGTVGATTLTEAQIPSHTHTYTAASVTNANSAIGSGTAFRSAVTANTGATGGGGSHTHSMDVAYVDVIIATKD